MTTDNDSVRAKRLAPPATVWLKFSYPQGILERTVAKDPEAVAYVPSKDYDDILKWISQNSDCEWLEDGFDGSWDTSCGNKYQLTDGTPEDNHMKFCVYCGGHLVATPNGGGGE